MVQYNGTKGMRIEKRKATRLAFKLSLTVSLAATGYFLAGNDTNVSPYAIVAAILGIAMAIGAESLMTSTEDETLVLEERIAFNRKRYAETIAMQDEKLAKFERIAKVLEDQNHDMRAELITTLVRKQRNNET